MTVWLLLFSTAGGRPELSFSLRSAALKSCSCFETYAFSTHSPAGYRRFSKRGMRTTYSTYLLHFLLVPLLEARDVTSSLFGFFNLFPRFHFFLFQEGDTVRQQLGVTVDARGGVRSGK